MPTSCFTTPDGPAWLADWSDRVLASSRTPWQRLSIDTRFGSTVVHAARAGQTDLPALVVLPGFRTCGPFWDLNDNMAVLGDRFRIYLVDVIGQPSLSGGETPPVRGPGYGEWLVEVLDGLELAQVHVAGASFGGLLAMKLATAAPQRVRSVILMATAGLQDVSFHPMRFWPNLLPLLRPTEGTVRTFLERVVFTRTHTLPPEKYALLVEYQLFAIKRFKLRPDYPYTMSRDELSTLKTPTWVMLGDKDPMFQHERSAKRARQDIPGLEEVIVLPDHGHGIETSLEATRHLLRILTR